MENIKQDFENIQQKMKDIQKRMKEAELFQLKERAIQGSHVCFEIPTSKEDAPDWFDFEEKLIGTAVLGCDNCLALLIRAGADVNEVDVINCTALMKASKYGHLGCVSLLLEAGADVNIPDIFGVPALGQAVDEMDLCTGTFLLEGIRNQKKCAQALIKEIVCSNVTVVQKEQKQP